MVMLFTTLREENGLGINCTKIILNFVGVLKLLDLTAGRTVRRAGAADREVRD